MAYTRTARAGHEMPFYPSYYPQEITLETLTRAAAGAALDRHAVQAYIGPDPYSGRRLPKDALSAESLAGWLVLTFRPGAPREVAEPTARVARAEARCRQARSLAARLPTDAGWVRHPSVITPWHADQLHHADRLAAAARAVEAAGPRGRRADGPDPASLSLLVAGRGELAARLLGDARVASPETADAVLEEVAVPTTADGAEPPWIREGWFHAWRLYGASGVPPTPEATALHDRLVAGEGESLAERIGRERRLVAALEGDCRRVVLGYTLRVERLDGEYSQGVENAAHDAHRGLASEIFARTVKLKDFPWNGWLTLGTDAPPQAAWNPVAGFGDGAGRLLWTAVGDPAMVPEPRGATWVGNRVRVVGAPEISGAGAIRVPADAVLPSADGRRLEPVGPGRSARARLVYRVLASAAHDGSRLDVSDVLYGYAFAQVLAADDPAAARATALGRRWLAGIRPLRVETDTLRFGDIAMKYSVPIVEVYLHGALPDAGQLAAVAPPWTAVPWHVLELYAEAVRRGAAVFSDDAARRTGRPWLDVVRDAALRAHLGALAAELEGRAHVPEALAGRVTAVAARQRWAALRQFAAERGHWLVTAGPYQVHAWPPGGAVLRVFRDFSYPMGVGTWNAWAIPLRARVTRVEPRGDRLVVRGEAERVERFAREYRLVTGPVASPAAWRDQGGVVPALRWVVLDAAGAVSAAGTAEADPTGAYTVPLGARAGRGGTALVALVVGANAVGLEPRIVSLPTRER